MANNTNISVRNLIIYSVYIRNHTEEGTFLAVIPDLERIKALGADVIWFMPIHPIGEKGKKGILGCPYANRDYRTVNPCYGTMEDFKKLVDAIHGLGMRCMIDVVYNHTSPDATLVSEHPEFYYRKPDGSFGNRCGEWADVIDLDYGDDEHPNTALWDYQIESLKMWAGLVDGFRCDVASCIPVEFWKKARTEVAKVNPGCLWLAETVHDTFNQKARAGWKGAWSDSEMFKAFDIEYDYDIREVFDRYIYGDVPLSCWLYSLNLQETAYANNYSKLRCLENHDNPRAKRLFPDEKSLRNATAMLYFLKGTTLIYAGQEFECTDTPSLFEKEVFPRDTGRDISFYLARLAEIKKTVLSPADYFLASADDKNNIAVMIRDDGERKKIGVFSLSGREADVRLLYPNFSQIEISDGNYTNVLSGEQVRVTDGVLHTCGDPVIIVTHKRR